MSDRAAKAEISEVLQNWLLWRDTADWARFATVWHEAGHMSATWFDGSATDFIEASRLSAEHGTQVAHLFGGTTIDVTDTRAIAHTRISILQRGTVDGVEVDVTGVGRFYDFFLQDERGWRIRRRQGIYDKDWLTTVHSPAQPNLDATLLSQYPPGYRHTAYLQTKAGLTVRKGLPGRTGPELEQLYQEGRNWLAGAPEPGIPV
jgi:hypothetical protein